VQQLAVADRHPVGWHVFVVPGDVQDAEVWSAQFYPLHQLEIIDPLHDHIRQPPRPRVACAVNTLGQ
jgi:hypothetical protein